MNIDQASGQYWLKLSFAGQYRSILVNKKTHVKALEKSEIIQDICKTDNNQSLSDPNDVIQAMDTSIGSPYVTVTNVLQARLYILCSYQVIIAVISQVLGCLLREFKCKTKKCSPYVVQS